MGVLSRLRRRYTSTSADDEARELRSRAGELGVLRISDIADRSIVEVSGVARSMTHRPVGTGPVAQIIQLYDGTGMLDVVWLGRRGVRGIHPGVHLRVHGRVRVQEGHRIMYNPRYEIVPGI